MLGLFRFIMVAAISLTQTVPALSAPENKNHETKHWHGYGFLPGFTPREMLACKREREAHYYRLYGPQYYGPAWPDFYRGRWNGGRFGPCWTQTPIGPMWNCGR